MREDRALSLVSEAVALRTRMRSVEIELLSGEVCGLLAEEMARVEKASAALRAMAAVRAVDCGAHRGAGFADPDEWLARMTGETRHKARADLATGSRLADCPTTRAAAVDGELSLGQAEDITETEREKPGSERELVNKARTSTRQQLSEECRKRRQAGVDPEELAAKQRARRSFRPWIDDEGMQSGLFKLEPIAGVALLSRIQVEADRLHREARRAGSDEPWEAHAADALQAILEAGLGWSPSAPVGTDAAPPPPPTIRKPRAPRRADVVIVVDLRTYRTGLHEESVCHVIGGGPVPPDIVREMAKDAFLKVVFHDGVNVHTVTHVGRYRKAELETALELGGPPAFDGVTCSVCGNKFRLEWDHKNPVCAGAITSFENEDPKCWRCHSEKSRREREAGLYDRGRRRSRSPTPTSSLASSSAWSSSGPDPPDTG